MKRIAVLALLATALLVFGAVGPRGQAVVNSAIPSTTATVTTATTVYTMQDIGDLKEVSLQVANTGAALTDFIVQLQDSESGAWYNYLSGTDWASTTNPAMQFSSTAVNTLASGSTGHVHFRINGANGFRIVATTGSSTSVTVVGNVKP